MPAIIDGQKQTQRRGWVRNHRFYAKAGLRRLSNISCLGTFLALHDFKFHLIAFGQALVAFRGDGAVMHEHIGAVLASDEAVTFSVVEPLHCTFQSFHLLSPSVRAAAVRLRRLPPIPDIPTHGALERELP